MDHRVFHVLTETEPFSQSFGGAISRWVGNVTAQDEDTTIICPETDGSWGLPPTRLRVLPEMTTRRSFPQTLGAKIAWAVNKHLLANMLIGSLHDLREQDIVWVHNRPERAAALSSYVRRRKANLVLHMHNSHISLCPPNMLQDLKPTKSVFCSSFLEKEALGFWPKLGPTVAVVNGANDNLFFPAPPSPASESGAPLTVLFVGRLVPEKGPHVLIEAMRILHARQVPVRARIIGSAYFGTHSKSEYSEGLRDGAPPNVEFAGFVEPNLLGAEFRKSDVFCCPSTWNEPFGMTNVEAMATGIPVIATRCGGIPEIFAEGGALLVEPNSAEQIADACELLAKDPDLRAKVAREGLASYKKNFTWRAVHEQYRKVIESLW